ncbi:hypothetical protein K190097F3_24680 [Enterocloster clostridioformis]
MISPFNQFKNSVIFLIPPIGPGLRYHGGPWGTARHVPALYRKSNDPRPLLSIIMYLLKKIQPIAPPL